MMELTDLFETINVEGFLHSLVQVCVLLISALICTVTVKSLDVDV